MPRGRGARRLEGVTEMHSTLDRLEARLELQAARIDELERRLRALLAHSLEQDGEPLSDEFVQVEDSPLVRSEPGPSAR